MTLLKRGGWDPSLPSPRNCVIMLGTRHASKVGAMLWVKANTRWWGNGAPGSVRAALVAAALWEEGFAPSPSIRSPQANPRIKPRLFGTRPAPHSLWE